MARSPPRRRHDEYSRDRRDDRSYRRRSPSRDRRDDARDRRDTQRNRDRHRERDRDRERGRDRDQERDRERDRRGPRRDLLDSRNGSRYDAPPRSRRDRSSSRRRSPNREASPVRDHGRLSKRSDRGDDGYDRRDSKRAKLDSGRLSREASPRSHASPDPKKRGRAEDPEQAAAVKARQERLAKVEAWKQQTLEKKKQEEAHNPSSAGVDSTTSRPTTSAGSPAPAEDEPGPATPPRAPFDPKAIKKRTEAKLRGEAAPLGTDAIVPVSTVASNGSSNGKRDVSRPSQSSIDRISSHDAKVTGFGLRKTAGEKSANPSAEAASNLVEDDEDVQRKFVKLPDLQQTSMSDDAALANDAEDQDEGGDDLQSDSEEVGLATREAAQKRAEEARAEQQDTEMADAAPPAAVEAQSTDMDEDVDPLDAFMSTIDQTMVRAAPAHATGKRGLQVFDEDGGPDLEAVGDDTEELLNNSRKKKKEIPNIDHAKVEYESFRKNFYHESIEIAEMSQGEVDALRTELDNIQVRGIDPPRPITKWSQCGFGAQILDIIRENKFESPTSIQCQALPAIMSGRDTIGIAKTGSGKTLAFILPMFRHIKDQRPVAHLEGPIGLIMAPTRELAVQIHRECKPYLRAVNLRGVCAYGGAPIKDQIAELKRGAEVVVCTPGRLIDLLAANGGRVTNLKRVTYVVMDEADRMFDMGFEPQIAKVLGNIRPDRQTVTFSATFPKKMESLARKALTKPTEIVVGGRSVVAKEITQIIEVRAEDTKFRRVLELLGNLHENDEDARSLIFVERQDMADILFKELGKMSYPSLPVHGGREQMDRDQAISDFKAGIIPIMVATSVAARGLDVKQLKLVINYDSPNHGEDYVHRAGRTGRAGNTGTAVTFVTPEQERFAPFLVRALQDSDTEVPEALREMASAHKRKVESGEAKNIGSGFGGRGIERIDAARTAERAWEKSQYKTGDEPDDDDHEREAKDQKEKSVNELVAKAAGSVKDRDAPSETAPATAAATAEAAPVEKLSMDQKLVEHLENAKRVQKAEKPDPPSNDPKARAAAAAAAINSRLGTKGSSSTSSSSRPGAPVDNRGPDAGAFHATLEFNDFPQEARWAVTNRTNVAKILDATGVSITSKGVWYAPGKVPAAGDQPKLYTLVEGDTEIAVAAAMRELARHLTEGTLLAQQREAARLGGSGGGGGGTGRYKVV